MAEADRFAANRISRNAFCWDSGLEFCRKEKKRGVNTQLNYEASLQIVLRQGYTENMNAHGHGW